MNDSERDELRALQDRYLALPAVKRFAGQSGTNVPLWTGGPTILEVTTTVLPDWKYAFEVAIHNHRREDA